jgi:tricorn protease
MAVAKPSAGWVVSTPGLRLIDGSFLRPAFIRVTTADAEPTKLYPRPVDVFVKGAVGDSYTGHDVQLDAAVHELLREIAAETGVSSTSRAKAKSKE